MPRRGHVVIDGTGGIVAADAGFAAIVRLPAATLVDRNVFDFAAPAEHESARRVLAHVRDGGLSPGSVRRFVTPDGAHLWVRSQVARIAARPQHFRLTIETTDVPPGWAPPGDLLRVARTLIDVRRDSRAAFGALMIADPGWDILLAAYVHEAEGAVLDMAAWSDAPASSMGRWVKALESEGLVEVERGADSVLVYLSPIAHRRVETLLSTAARGLYPPPA